MERKITYISITEDRTFYSHSYFGQPIELRYSACIQESTEGRKSIRTYKCSHWSIKRLAKIQDKLAG